MKKKLFVTLLALSAFAAFAGGNVNLSLLKERIGGQDKIKSIKPSVIPGLYEVQINNQIIYLSADGEKVISGEIYDLKNKKSITEQASNELRKSALAAVADSDKIIYKAKKERYKVTVFTDISCPYCTKIHRKVPEFNELGITIEYLAFPRAGVGSRTANKMQKIWCAKNKTVAFSEASENREYPEQSCDGNQVGEQFKLGEELGIGATPTMVLNDGELLAGYMKPKDLLTYLQNKQK